MKVLGLVTLFFLSSMVAGASHLSTFGAIDAIDHDFGGAGGFFSGSLLDPTDNLWVTFDATAGDLLNIQIVVTSFKNAVLLQDTADGVFNIGDLLGVSNFNVDHTGEGVDLTILSHIGSLEFQTLGTLMFVAPYSGQYGIAVSAANNESSFAGGPIDITLSGNSAGASVPEPSSLFLFGFGLAALAVRRALGSAGKAI
jgi:hypothetical protein